MKVLIAGAVPYDSDHAAKFRVLEVASALGELGHDVTVFDGLSRRPATAYGDGPAVRIERRTEPTSRTDRAARKVGIGYALLRHPLARERFDAVYCYGSELSWLLACWRIARRSRARLIADVTELYGFEDMFTSLSSFRQRIGTWLGIVLVIPLLTHAVAAPSRRFVKLFQRLGVRAELLLPFFGEIAGQRERARGGEILTFAYAGVPSNKDALPLVLRAFEQLRVPAGQLIRFVIVGPSETELREMAAANGVQSVLSRQGLQIEAIGRVSVASARQVVKDADFSVVIRFQSVRVNFGFPSKVAEAFQLGTPIISNAYSDIPRYLVDGRNGWLVRDESITGVCAALERCLSMSRAELEAMHAEAAQTGRAYFSPAAVGPVLAKLVGA